MADQTRKTARGAEFSASVRVAVASLMSEGHPHIRRTAETLGTSVRTLQRILAENGDSYTEIVDQVRLEQADLLLRESGRPIWRVAMDLGFADAGSFTRAFERWTGQTPRSYRRKVAPPATRSSRTIRSTP